jgi:chromosome segregation ATPase
VGKLTFRLTTAHTRLQDELQSSVWTIEAHQKGMEEAKDAHTKATEALVELRAARDADETVLNEVKEELDRKERLLAQAMEDLKATSEIEEKLRGREQEIESVKAGHEEQLAELREQLAGGEAEAVTKYGAEIKVGHACSRLPC